MWESVSQITKIVGDILNAKINLHNSNSQSHKSYTYNTV